MNLMRLEIPDRCYRFSERVGCFLPFIAGALVLSAVYALSPDRRRVVRGHVQELRRRHLHDAPAELTELLRLLADVERNAEEKRRARADRRRRERLHHAALVENRRQRRRQEIEIEELLAFDDDAGSLVPGLVEVHLTPEQWEALV